MPAAHALSVWMGVAACRCPTSSRAMQRGTQPRAFWKTAPSSASVADAMKFHMMELMVWTALLHGVGVEVWRWGWVQLVDREVLS
jgi:hypothetical protein